MGLGCGKTLGGVGYIRSFTRKPSDIEVSLNAPRHVPQTNQASQFLPWMPSITIRIGPVYPHKSPWETIFNVSKRASHSKLPLRSSSFSTTFLSRISKIAPEAPLEAEYDQSTCWQPHKLRTTLLETNSSLDSCEQITSAFHCLSFWV
jgi:hypothetical protein